MFSRGIKTKLLSMALGALLTTSLLSGCSSSTSTSAAAGTVATPGAISAAFDSNDLNTSWNAAEAVNIVLAGNTASLSGQGAQVDGNSITIRSAGTYVVSGIVTDGQMIIDAGDEDVVKLVLNGVDIACWSGAPVYVKNAGKVVITLAPGTINTIADGTAYTSEDDSSGQPDAAVFSKDDITINGTGTLTISSKYGHGIHSKDDLKITGGNITITSAADGLKGKDCVAMQGGTLTVTAGQDGMQATNSEDAEKGFVYIDGTVLDITAGADGIQAETSILVRDGTLKISAGGGNGNGVNQSSVPGPNAGGIANSMVEDTTSTKGLKAGANITVENGSITLDTADDAVHAAEAIVVNGGVIDILAGDDGMHADASLTVNAGQIHIAKSYEGLESAIIAINNGSIDVTAADDGINTSGGKDGSSINGRPGQNNFDASDGSRLDINGGCIVVDAQGDGIDVNGDFQMTGGTVIVNGPVNDGNGALDYNGTFAMNGGFLVAAGSAGMAQAPSNTSSQASLKLNLGSQAAGTLVSVQTQDGKNLLTFAPQKNYASVVFSSPQLSQGATYNIYTGGSSTGTATDGLYSGGVYTPGTLAASVTLSGPVTEYGQSAGSMPGRPMGSGQGRPAPQQ